MVLRLDCCLHIFQKIGHRVKQWSTLQFVSARLAKYGKLLQLGVASEVNIGGFVNMGCFWFSKDWDHTVTEKGGGKGRNHHGNITSLKDGGKGH